MISVDTIFNYVYNFVSLVLLMVATVHLWTNLVGNMQKLQVIIVLSHQYHHSFFQQCWEIKRCHWKGLESSTSVATADGGVRMGPN